MRSILHIALAVLLFIGQSGILVHQHFCKEKLMATRLFVEAPSCHQQAKGKVCPMHAQKDADRKSCCDDQANYESADLSGLLSISADLVNMTWSPALSVFPWTMDLSAVPSLNETAIRIHGPPPELRRHHSWWQVFRC